MHTIIDCNLVRILGKHFFLKPLSMEFSPPEKNLNAHNSLIKQHIAMNSASLDSPYQRASPNRKILPCFFHLREIRKKQKQKKMLAPTPTNSRNFPYA
jgi:hypothetical protein